jgi:hypothetical protein
MVGTINVMNKIMSKHEIKQVVLAVGFCYALLHETLPRFKMNVMRETSMLPTHFLKRYFPNSPDWLLGGIFLLIILWLLVLPIEVVQFVIRQELLPATYLGRIVKSLYMLGFWISIELIPSWIYSSSAPGLIRLVVVLLGLLISSPAYFAIGALLATRKAVTMILGLLLLVADVLFGLYVLIMLFYSG